MIRVNVLADVFGHIGVGRRNKIKKLCRVLFHFSQLLHKLLVCVFLFSLVVDEVFYLQLALSSFRSPTPSILVFLGLTDKWMFNMFS